MILYFHPVSLLKSFTTCFCKFLQIPEPLKTKTLVTGVEIFGKEAQEKLEERAKRFGLKMGTEKSALQDAENLYERYYLQVICNL